MTAHFRSTYRERPSDERFAFDTPRRAISRLRCGACYRSTTMLPRRAIELHVLALGSEESRESCAAYRLLPTRRTR
jgi:hypothetical protein